MFSYFAKILLVGTSLSPILGAIAIRMLSERRPWYSWLPWLVGAPLLVFFCWLLLRYAAQAAQKQSFKIQTYENKDKEVLAFLIAYLLPFVSSQNLFSVGGWITGMYIFGIIFMVVAHAEAFHFNPLMALLGYHFYTVRSEEGMLYLLISKQELYKTGETITAVTLTRSIRLHKGDDS
jgi:MFS family permease